MRVNFKFALVTLMFALVGTALALAESQSQVVEFPAVPPPAQKTMLAESGDGNGKLGEIERVQEDGEIWYDATLRNGKVERSFSVAPDGKLLSYQVFMREIPEAARKAIRKEVRENKDNLEDIYRVVDEGKTTYEVDMTKGEREISFSVGEDGKLLTMQVTLEETPAAVQKAIRAQAAGAVIKTIEKNTGDEGGEVAYDVDVEKGGRKISFSVDAEGKLIED